MFSISPGPIDGSALGKAMQDHAAGAFVLFEGRVRNENEGQVVTSLEYEAYEEMCHRQGQSILDAAKERFGVIAVTCVHRSGHLALGDVAVWLGVLGSHRGEAFAACRWIIDEIKVVLPIWKKEHYASGDSGWVRCEACAAGHDHHHSVTQDQASE